MHELFDDPTVLYNRTNFLDYALRGVSQFENQQVDPMVSNELWNDLFKYTPYLFLYFKLQK